MVPERLLQRVELAVRRQRPRRWRPRGRSPAPRASGTTRALRRRPAPCTRRTRRARSRRCVPVRSSSWRRKSASVRRVSTSRVHARPFTVTRDASAGQPCRRSPRARRCLFQRAVGEHAREMLAIGGRHEGVAHRVERLRLGRRGPERGVRRLLPASASCSTLRRPAPAPGRARRRRAPPRAIAPCAAERRSARTAAMAKSPWRRANSTNA